MTDFHNTPAVCEERKAAERRLSYVWDKFLDTLGLDAYGSGLSVINENRELQDDDLENEACA